MIPEKTLPIHELKYYHSDNLGFVFIGATPSSDEAIQRLGNFLVDIGVSEKLPEFYQRIGNATAFMYDGNSGFQSGAFYQASNRISFLNNFFKIETLTVFLNGL